MSTGMYPTEAEVHEIIQVVEDPSTQGVVKYERFVPYAVKMLLDGKMWGQLYFIAESCQVEP